MAKKEKSTENNKNKNSFFKGFKAELKKVSWPTPKQLANNTVAVIAIVLLTTIIVFALDIVFEAVNNQGVEKLKQVISSSSNTTNETENNTTDDGAATETTEGTSENTTGEATEKENQDVQEVQIEDQTQNTETTQTENTVNQ